MTTPERRLMELTQAVAEAAEAADISEAPAYDEWLREVQGASPRTLVVATSLLSSSGSRPANVKALREAIIAEIERKNTEHLIRTMEKLDKSAARLGAYSLVLAAIGIALATIQVLQAFKML